ncbi:MAG: hypothetical protein Kow0065_20960 [Methylomicrobium sp.]
MVTNKIILTHVKTAIALTSLFTMTACGPLFSKGYGEQGLSREAFEQYVEEVFRLQNGLTNDVMLLSLNDDESDQLDELLLAEHQMHETCSPLNEYVLRNLDHQSIGLFLMRRIEKSAESCERAAKQVELLLTHMHTQKH